MDDINPNNIFEDNIDTKNVLLSLKNFSQHSKVYQTVLTYLSHNFSDKEELNKLKKIFYKIDLNLDGKLSKSEFEHAFKEAEIEMTKEQLDNMLKSIDFDGNCFIEYEEFIRVALPKEKLFTEKNLKIAFEMFDLDKNGMISLEEFKTILRINKIKDKKVIKEFFKLIKTFFVSTSSSKILLGFISSIKNSCFNTSSAVILLCLSYIKHF